MKPIALASLCFLLACSSPRYLYRFSEPKGVAVNRQAPVTKVADSAALPMPVTLATSPHVYTANAAAPAPILRDRIHRLDERPAIQRADPPGTKTPPAKGRLDGDLLRAGIFTAFGVVALLIGGNFFVVTGSLSLLIGLIFGIKWFIRR